MYKKIMKNYTFLGSFLFGVGIIGMLDGIIFHQLLQWHSTYIRTNRFNQIISDGIFHLSVTVVIFVAAILLWKSDPNVKKEKFWGGFFLGAGWFNFLEGIINHHFLKIHHVKPGTYQLMYDLAYDTVGIVLIIIGWFMYKKGK